VAMDASNEKSAARLFGGQLAQNHVSITRSDVSSIRELDDNSRAKLAALKVLARTVLNEIDELLQGNTSSYSFSELVASFEAQLIRNTLTHTGGRQRRAACLLGMKVSTLHRKIKLYKLGALSNQETDQRNDIVQ